MKKKLAVLLTVVLVCSAVLFGCKGKSDLEGTTWSLSGGKQGDVEITEEQLTSIMGEMTYEFKKDGVMVVSYGDTSEETTYKQNGKKVTLGSKDDKVEASIDGDKMTIKTEDVTLYLTKK